MKNRTIATIGIIALAFGLATGAQVHAEPATQDSANAVETAEIVPAESIQDFGAGGKWALIQSPSGNIGCALGPAVSCEVRGGDKAFSIVDGKARLTQPYAESTVNAAEVPPQVLKYGQTVTFGNYACTSRERGINCSDTGHSAWGFISREHVEVH